MDEGDCSITFGHSINNAVGFNNYDPNYILTFWCIGKKYFGH